MCKFTNLTLKELDENQEIIGGTEVKGYYQIISVETKKTGRDERYILWKITDRSNIKKVMRTAWIFDEKLLKFSSGMVVQVVATIDTHNGGKKLVVNRNPDNGHFMIRIPTEGELDGITVTPTENNSLSKVELTNYIMEIKDLELKKLVESIVFSPEMETIFAVPASKQFHHTRIGGLARYIIDIIDIALLLADRQQIPVDRDLLIAGAILFNSGKIYSLDNTNREYTLEYRALGINGLSIRTLYQHIHVAPNLDKRKLLLLENVIYSKDTEELEGTLKPVSIEAHILHRAANAVANVNSVGSYIEQDGTLGDLTSYSKMHRQYFVK